MSKTRGQIKADIQSNLQDLSMNFFSDQDLNDAIQDAYNDVAIMSQCIQKKVTLNWISDLNYYDFVALGVPDYLGTIAIFNHVTNLYLRDDLNLKDFDRIRRDWEKWIGTPQFWAPSDFKRIAICAKYTLGGGTSSGGAFYSSAFSNAFFVGTGSGAGPISLGTFDLLYWATAPTLVSDSDTFLIAADKDQMITQFATAELLEQPQEFSKSNDYWALYYDNLQDYQDRVKRLNRSDLLLRI